MDMGTVCGMHYFVCALTHGSLQSKMITPSIISDRLKMNVSVARRAIKELLAQVCVRA